MRTLRLLLLTSLTATLCHCGDDGVAVIAEPVDATAADGIATRSDLGAATDSVGGDGGSAADTSGTAVPVLDALSDDGDATSPNTVDAKVDSAPPACQTATDCPTLPCKVGACTVNACTWTNVAEASLCNDNNACTLNDACYGGQCMAGAGDLCDDQNLCTADTCDPKTGCAHAPQLVLCDDGDACTQADACHLGKCAGGGAVTCADNNPCTQDSCDPNVGCAFSKLKGPCDDGNACTVGDACANGLCLPGSATACDDGKPCTLDGCNPKGGCVFAPQPGPCSDGDACTQADQCQDGSCKPGTPASCDDTNPCTVNGCDPTKGCAFAPASGPCDDGSACTVGDACGNGACLPGATTNCDDGNPCTGDVCDPKLGCQHGPQAASCSDGSACTVGDACAAGACVAGKNAQCSDGNPCTADTCDPAKGCAFAETTAACSDGSACTQGDACQAGACVPGKTLACDDGNPCTFDVCDPAKGCATIPTGQPCDDGDACTLGDACANAACAPGKAVGCNDGNPCTDDSCDKTKGCAFADNIKACDDSNACTTGDVCKAGACVAGVPPGCDDQNPCTTETCDPAQGCKNVPNTLPCDDNDACTGGDACANAACVPGKAIACSDGNPCTDDACKPQGGCAFLPNAGNCTDGNACTASDACKLGSCAAGSTLGCDDANACTNDWCDPAKGCVHQPNGAPCDDGNACTAGDSCKGEACAAGSNQQCTDGNPCTTDACDPKIGCAFAASNDPCSDGSACTGGDVCKGGVCLPGAPTSCDDKNACTTDSCDPKIGCASVANDWPCDDGDLCTVGDVCKTGGCAAGKPLPCQDGNPCTDDACAPKAGCTFGPNIGGCDDGNACTGPDGCNKGACGGATVVCNDNNPCTTDYCDANAGCQAVANAQACDDGTACTKADVCSKAKCAGEAISCDDGNPCTGDACDAKAGCQNPAVANNTPCGAGNGGLCIAGACSLGSSINPATSCKQILDNLPGSKSGVYHLYHGTGPTKTIYQAYCDHTTQGGGWTLVLKADGSKGTFAYNGGMWTSTLPLNDSAPAMDATEAKFASYAAVAHQEVLLVGKVGAATNTLVLPATATSLYALLASGAYSKTAVGRVAWKNLMTGSSLQLNCNQEGFNTQVGGWIACRMGILNNQENDCATPDSFLGVGCTGGSGVSTGNYANGSWQPDNGGVNFAAFVWVLVR